MNSPRWSGCGSDRARGTWGRCKRNDLSLEEAISQGLRPPLRGSVHIFIAAPGSAGRRTGAHGGARGQPESLSERNVIARNQRGCIRCRFSLRAWSDGGRAYSDHPAERWAAYAVGFGPQDPYAGASRPERWRKSLSRLWVAQMSFHSWATRASPRRRKRRRPRTSLIWPKTGSTVILRRA